MHFGSSTKKPQNRTHMGCDSIHWEQSLNWDLKKQKHQDDGTENLLEAKI